MHETWTIGEVLIDGTFFCYALEDRARLPGQPKVPGHTAIPPGVYPLEWRYSSKFKRKMPFLANVPQFFGVMIHWGAHSGHTRGCILLGRKYSLEAGRLFECEEADAFADFREKVEGVYARTRVIVSEDHITWDQRQVGGNGVGHC